MSINRDKLTDTTKWDRLSGDHVFVALPGVFDDLVVYLFLEGQEYFYPPHVVHTEELKTLEHLRVLLQVPVYGVVLYRLPEEVCQIEAQLIEEKVRRRQLAHQPPALVDEPPQHKQDDGALLIHYQLDGS